MGVRNQGARDWYMEMPAGTDPNPCSEPTTHYLKGQPLCEKHWKQGLEARDAANGRIASYHRQLGNYQGRR
jgi:hypothetical protein